MNTDLFSATILLLLVLDPFGNLPLVVSATLAACRASATRASCCANACSPS